MRPRARERTSGRHHQAVFAPGRSFVETLARCRELATEALLASIPSAGPPHLYDLVSDYPRRRGKGLRAALCLAACRAFGGDERRALNLAVAIELFHNGFLIHDDVQDESVARRGGWTLHRSHGVGIAVNVGNATNLLAMGRILASRQQLGDARTRFVVEETERMMRQTLEGQAIELAWIRNNICDLEPADYLRMCLKKTSWYSFIYPMRVGAAVAGAVPGHDEFLRFGWYLGAAFQIQDDILNLRSDYGKYGKEVGGDLREGKRTLMLIRLFDACTGVERRMVEEYLATPRGERTAGAMERLRALMDSHEAIDFASRAARQLSGAALLEGLRVLRCVPDSAAKRFILQMVMYVVSRDR